MSPRIERIALGKGSFAVNAYLISTDDGFVLVDTGMRRHRAQLMEALAAAGCEPGKLKLLLITHGDMDHIGNAVHVRDTFEVPIAMHAGDVGMTRDGDMFAGRRQPSWATRLLVQAMLRLPENERFVPDIDLAENPDLSEYGLASVEIMQLRGHSSGSVVVLFEDGSLISGDLVENTKKPAIGSIMDDVSAAKSSVRQLGANEPGRVYPGHGVPFDFSELPEV